MVIITVLGGSTNAVLHLIAIAHAAGVHLTMEDFQAVSNRVPVLADLKPSGKYLMEDLSKIGGVPAVQRTLLDYGLLNGDLMTVTGRTLAENLADVQPLGPEQDLLRPLDQPIKADGHIQMLYGNPAGVAKNRIHALGHQRLQRGYRARHGRSFGGGRASGGLG